MCLDDAYRVERVLAQGAGGTTELVSINGAGPFVRKKMRTELANRRVWLALADRPCARLPRVQATYELPDHFVAVYDYVPGETLETVVAARGPLPAEQAIAIARQVCEAVGSLHDLGIVHRDVSPANIVVAADGAHLIDLGIARLHVANAPRDTTSLGTWGFASPEQYGFAQTDARSDVYSIGRLLGYMLTGLLPDADGYADALLDEKLCPPQLRAVTERACAFEPSARYQSITELVAALDDGGAPGGGDGNPGQTAEKTPPAADGLTAETPAAEQPARREREAFWAHRARRGALASAGAAAGLILVGAVVMALLPQTAPTDAGAPSQTGDAAAIAGDSATGADDPAMGADDPGTQNVGASFASDIATMAVYAALRDTYGEEATRDYLVSQGLPADAFAGNGAPDGGAGTGTANASTLEIVDSCWSRAAHGLIHYSVALKNTSANQRVEYPAFQIIGRDADGSVLFADDMVLAGLEPGETQWYGSVAGSSTTPTTVEFVPVEPDSWQRESPTTARASYAIDGLREVSSAGTTLFTGEVTCTHDDGVNSNDLLVTVILRDDAGAVIYGESTRTKKPAEGASIAFQVIASGCPTDYASMEAYAYTC